MLLITAGGGLHGKDTGLASIEEILSSGAVTTQGMQMNPEYLQHIDSASQMHNVDRALIKAMISIESSGGKSLTSPAGAKGPMQLMPKTATALGVKNINNPAENIHGGTGYIRNLLDRYQGNIDLALAAYNAGPTNVSKYGGIPPFKETVNYIKKVKKAYMVNKGFGVEG